MKRTDLDLWKISARETGTSPRLREGLLNPHPPPTDVALHPAAHRRGHDGDEGLADGRRGGREPRLLGKRGPVAGLPHCRSRRPGGVPPLTSSPLRAQDRASKRKRGVRGTKRCQRPCRRRMQCCPELARKREGEGCGG